MINIKSLINQNKLCNYYYDKNIEIINSYVSIFVSLLLGFEKVA